MPKPKELLDEFAPRRAAEITGLSTHMLYYLARQGYLVPSYAEKHGRGRVRYYSYRDLVIGRIISSLLASGLEISRLKQGIQELGKETNWPSDGKQEVVKLLVSDGNTLFSHQPDGSLLDLTRGRQLTFAFVLDVGPIASQVREQLSGEQQERFSFKNRA